MLSCFSVCRLWLCVAGSMQRKAMSVINNIFFRSSNQNKLNLKLGSKLKSNPFQHSIVIPTKFHIGCQEVNGYFFLPNNGEVMDLFFFKTLSCVRFARGSHFCPHKKKKKLSVRTVCNCWKVKKKKKIKPKKQVLYQSPIACLKCFILCFYLEHHDLFTYILTNLWVRREWSKSWLDQNYTLSSLKYSLCISL